MQRSNAPAFIILGSGGHTAEMCKINKALLSSQEGRRIYSPVRYIVAKTDATSAAKLQMALSKVGFNVEETDFRQVPRSREVGQTWLSTVFSTVWALLWSFWLVWRDCPSLVLCNGPGTCVPFCVAAFFWRLVGRLDKKCKIVFVESLCRVETLSLSGKILLHIADVVVVQWPQLAKLYGHKSNVQYFGRLM